ncbi:tyrosine-type recombinase/integrase [Chromobacterium haemolyticum]|uniref:tyrosine-type recombinase/integrase n=1 Tax=Chromobacterium haemolyticum TaxID=394935 RepID=UPI004056E60C
MGGSTTSRRVALPEGVEIREGARGSRLRIRFTWEGKRRGETLDVPVNAANIKYAARLRGEVQNAIERGTFNYAAMFPNSTYARALARAGKKRYLTGDLVESYIETARQLQSLSPSTIASYARWARCRIVPKWGQSYIDELATPELREWIVGLSKQMKQKSVRNCVGLLSAVLNQAAADGIITMSPLEPIKLRTVLPRKKKADDDDIDPFNDDEIKAILDACKEPEVRALFQFAFTTGLRTGELIALKWHNIDARLGTVRVQDNIVSAEGGSVEKTTKTDTARDVPLLPAAQEALMTMKPISLMLGIGGYIFVNPNTGKRWSGERVMLEHWTRTLRRAQIRYRNQYQTRHTFASRLLMSGEAELLVAKLLGHTTVEMVRRHYGKYIKQPNGIVLRGNYSGFGSGGAVESGNSSQDEKLA